MSKKANYTDINLHKKYHQDLVFNYSEYPTKDHWSFDFTSDDFKKGFWIGIQKTKTKKSFSTSIYLFVSSFAIFAPAVKVITRDYNQV